MAAALGGLTGGGGPLGAASGLTGGLAGGDGGPLGAASGLTGGDGGPLGAASGLTSGLTGGDGGPLGAATGLAGGLLGGGEGLNVIGLVGVGSDDDALLDLSPAEKKKVKAQKAAVAAQNEQKRQAEIRKLQQQVRAQGKQATPEQQRLAQQIKESEAADRRDMARLDQQLGTTDPELYQQAMAGGGGASGASGPSQGLMYAYLVDSSTHAPTHTLTFANAAAAEQWYAQASASGSVEQLGPQMYFYNGAPPRPVGKMACMPIQTVQPIIPLQRSDGYPICCKPGSSSAGALGSAGSEYVPQRPAPPPRKKFTFEDAAQKQVEAAKARGDRRQDKEIHDEAVRDLEEACCGRKAANGGQQATASSGRAPGASNSFYPGAANGAPSSAAAGPIGSAPDAAAGGAGGDLLGGLGGGLLGSGQGLNVAGLLAIGSDDKALLDLNPAQKKEEKLKQKRAVENEQRLQQKQKQALEEQVKKQNNQATEKQKQTYQELLQREQAAKQANQRLDESMARDEAAEKQAGGLPGGLPVPGGLPTDSLTGGGLPGADALGGLPTSALPTSGLPTSSITGGLGL